MSIASTKLRQGQPGQTERDRIAAKWVAAHRGKLSEAANAAKVTPQYAHLVFRGKRKSKDGRVERELRKIGAPI